MGKKNIDDLKQEDRLKKNTIPNNNINNVTLISRVIFGTTSKRWRDNDKGISF